MNLLEGLPELAVLRQNWSGYAGSTRSRRLAVGGVIIGGGPPIIIAGPCAVESFEQTLSIALAVRDAGADMLRGGCFKPRTNPHSFQGRGREGRLEILAEVRRQTGLPVVTEVMDPRGVEEVAAVADMLQIGSRSMQNFPLLTEVGRSGLPVLLKRGWSATLKEWLCAAEYIAMEGNFDIVLCERGIRVDHGASYARNLLDLNVIEPLHRITPLPVIVDPSHAAGMADFVPSLSRAAIGAGADGLLLEVVAAEEMRLDLQCDAAQGILPGPLRDIVRSSLA